MSLTCEIVKLFRLELRCEQESDPLDAHIQDEQLAVVRSCDVQQVLQHFSDSFDVD